MHKTFLVRTGLIIAAFLQFIVGTGRAEQPPTAIPALPANLILASSDSAEALTNEPTWTARPRLITADGDKPEAIATTNTAPATFPSPTTQAATRPESSSAVNGQFPVIGGSYGLAEFIEHFAPYEPMYFVGGWRAPQIKFQFSIRYRLITPTGPLATEHQWLRGFNFAYSQTSLWDWTDPNSPFFYDSSYRPEAFYYLENVPFVSLPKSWQLGVQPGVGHESNGLKNPDHRSLNIVFIRPILEIGDPVSGLFIAFAPKFYDYIGSLSLNPDLPTYRGYCDIRLVVGQRDGLQLATIGRVGSHWDRGSAQIDLTYPLTKILGGNVDLSLDAQYFTGYGDTLLSYNRSSNVVRFGLALVR
jgi:outer membrane phospholipase A